MFALSMECIQGNPKDETGAFSWVEVKLNLPSSPNYDPAESWVSKSTSAGQLAADAYTFVDDGRNLGRTKDICDKTTLTVASRENYMGEQDDARKRRQTSQNSGAWVGAIFRASEATINILTSQEKWDKAKMIVQFWQDKIKSTDLLDRKQLEKHRGFMVHVPMAYPSLKPYLKGMHLTLEMWRPNRDKQGWKLPVNDWARLQEFWQEKGIEVETDVSYSDAPDFVKAAPQFKEDLEALSFMLCDEPSPLRVVRSKRLKAAGVTFVDASGSGVGSSTQGRSQGVSIMYGLTAGAQESSNWRELQNLVVSLEEENKSGNLHNMELFVCTDNQIAEKTFL